MHIEPKSLVIRLLLMYRVHTASIYYDMVLLPLWRGQTVLKSEKVSNVLAKILNKHFEKVSLVKQITIA